MTGEGRRRARWLFAGALGLLLANDLFLKGAGVLPGALTGKLSDLAGMLVAPVVLAALLGLGGLCDRAAVAVATAAVGLLFAALKLSAGAAGIYDGLLTGASQRLGLPLAARTVCDRSDLLALPFLAGGWALARALAGDRPLRRAGGLLLGLFACSATSYSQVPVAPHWDFAGRAAQRPWLARADGGGVAVQFGRCSAGGGFELGVELAPARTPLAIEAGELTVELAGERVAAATDGERDRRLEVPPGQNSTVRLYFLPHTTPPAPATGTLHLVVYAAGERHVFDVPLSFEERSVPWRNGGYRF
jgi:hypothetical protein